MVPLVWIIWESGPIFFHTFSVAMTILPKKKKGEQESDSDSDSSSEPAQTPRPHVGASGHGGSPPPSEDTAYHHSPDGIYHR